MNIKELPVNVKNIRKILVENQVSSLEKALFEVIQNSLDATRHLKEKGEIKITFLEDEGKTIVSIEDNGIGGDLKDVLEHYITLGNSSKKKGDIGKFGIGLKSLLGSERVEKVDIITSNGNGKMVKTSMFWHNGQPSYTEPYERKIPKGIQGTIIRIFLKGCFPSPPSLRDFFVPQEISMSFIGKLNSTQWHKKVFKYGSRSLFDLYKEYKQSGLSAYVRDEKEGLEAVITPSHPGGKKIYRSGLPIIEIESRIPYLIFINDEKGERVISSGDFVERDRIRHSRIEKEAIKKLARLVVTYFNKNNPTHSEFLRWLIYEKLDKEFKISGIDELEIFPIFYKDIEPVSLKILKKIKEESGAVLVGDPNDATISWVKDYGVGILKDDTPEMEELLISLGIRIIEPWKVGMCVVFETDENASRVFEKYIRKELPENYKNTRIVAGYRFIDLKRLLPNGKKIPDTNVSASYTGDICFNLHAPYVKEVYEMLKSDEIREEDKREIARYLALTDCSHELAHEYSSFHSDEFCGYQTYIQTKMIKKYLEEIRFRNKKRKKVN